MNQKHARIIVCSGTSIHQLCMQIARWSVQFLLFLSINQSVGQIINQNRFIQRRKTPASEQCFLAHIAAWLRMPYPYNVLVFAVPVIDDDDDDDDN